MAHRLLNPKKDTRIQDALADPDAYFREAKARARREVLAEMEQEARARGENRRLLPWKNS